VISDSETEKPAPQPEDPGNAPSPSPDAAPAQSPADGNGAKKKPEKVNWFAEIRGLAIMLLAVLGFHSLVAKPFYIPSESMMPALLVGDRLVVSKYPYGWSWVSVSFHLLSRGDWRVAGKTPEYGDIVIAVPPNRAEDYIKRVVALPGDRIAVVNGRIQLNGKLIPRGVIPKVRIPVDANAPCNGYDYGDAQVRLPSGETVCELEAYQETMPNGATYTVIDHMEQDLDNYPEVVVPEDHVFLMGDNRDHSADSRASVERRGLGGPIPLSSVGGRAEFITFSLDGSMGWNPLSWFGAFRGDRAWDSLRPALAPVAATNEGGDGAN